MFKVSLPIVLQLALVATPAAAQTLSQPGLSTPGRASLAELQGGPASWHARVLTALGGAVVGAGVGFFTSQVFTGDWDEDPGRYQVDRSLWAAVGGSVGFVVGFTVPLAGTGRAAPTRTPGLRGGRFALTAVEMDGKGLKTAYEAVEVLRPEWLITRGTHVLNEAPQERIEVYLDNIRLGGVQSLREVSAEIVGSMHFLDAGAASVRFGAGHSHGAILVVAKGGAPSHR